MSFIVVNFSPVGGQARSGNSPAHWSYQSDTDNLAAVQAADYFNEVGTQVSPGDFINVSLIDGKAILTVASIVLSPPGVVIDGDVIGAGTGGTGAFPVVEFVGTTKNLVTTDNLTFIVMNNPAGQSITIPANASEAFPIGAEIDFIRESIGTVVFFTAVGVTLESRDGLIFINAQYSAATLKKIGTDEWRLIGDLS